MRRGAAKMVPSVITDLDFLAGAAFLAFGDFLAFGLGEALGLFFDLRDLTDFFLDAGLLALGLLADGDDFETTRKVLAWPAAGASTPFSTPKHRQQVLGK